MSQLPFRPEGFEGAIEKHLAGLEAQLVRILGLAQTDLTHKTLKLSARRLKIIAGVLVELAEDIHCGLGLWRSVEQYNREFFGTPLPLIPGKDYDPASTEISPLRVRHFLWVLYPKMLHGAILAPDHTDLVQMADVASVFLRQQFARLPKESGISQFLGESNRYGWDVKRKLVWLGTQSYLFRLICERYLEDKNATSADITVLDDFLCQKCTRWSGLGALEVLASVLNLPPEQRNDLLAWSERHNALYQVLKYDMKRLELQNVISDGKYTVRVDAQWKRIAPGTFIRGSLVPWNGDWYWSGQQTTYKRLQPAAIDHLKREYRMRPMLYYRYSPGALKKARDVVAEHHDQFVAKHGKDWVVYPNGPAMADDLKPMIQEQFGPHAPEVQGSPGSKTPAPHVGVPPEVLETQESVAVYLNPLEGLEFLPQFDAIRAGLRKRGGNLSPIELDAICNWIMSESTSPGFVARLTAEYGDESIKAAFLLPKDAGEHALEYLLRRYKGRYYRPRYPAVAVVD